MNTIARLIVIRCRNMNASSTNFDITQRNELSFEFENLPNHWCGNNPYSTAFFNAMSVMAPATEKLVITALRNVENDVKDDKLKKDIKGLIMQEGMHSRIHRSFNKVLLEQGYDSEAGLKIAEEAIVELSKGKSDLELIAISAAGEHIIWAIGYELLTSKPLAESMSPKARKLYQWHSLEELEHKAVCRDTFNHLSHSTYIGRSKAFVDATRILATATKGIVQLLLEVEAPEDLSWKNRRQFAKHYLSLSGHLTRIGLRSLSYLSPRHKAHFNETEMNLIRTYSDQLQSA